MHHQVSSRTQQQAFIAMQIHMMPHDYRKTGDAEEEIIVRLVSKFGKPHDGNTDWWRHDIRRLQGRRKNVYIRG